MDASAERKPQDQGSKFWQDQLSLADTEEKDWRKQAAETVERYRDERSELMARGTRVNIFASNVAILQPNVYGQTPVPDVRRRNIREDPGLRQVGAGVAKLIERALAYVVDDTPFDRVMESVRDDMLLTGRGVGWEVYEADITRREDVQRMEQPVPVDPFTGSPMGPPLPPVYMLDGAPVEPDFDAKGAPFIEQKTDERTITEFVFWADFRMSPARCWRDVWWVARRHTMTRAELREEFGEAGLLVPLTLSAGEGDTYSPMTSTDGTPVDPPSRQNKAEVWEIWDKRKRERVWIGKSYDKVIRTDPDPLKLRDFFPCPEPLYNGLRTTDKMEPLPEFSLYRDQANELDEVQSRIQHLERVLKAIVFVDGDFTEAIKIETAGDGTAIPVDRPGETAGSLNDAIFWWPGERIIGQIAELRLRSRELQDLIWQVTGMHDVMRGAGKERESAAAQKLKTSFGQVRMTPRSLPMARFVRDVYRIKAEIMAELFDPATLERISGEAVTPEMLALMREEKIRNTSIAVATDATVRPDQQAEQEQAFEFMQASTAFLQQVAAVGQVQPAMVPLMLETFRQTARTMKWSRNIEPLIDQTVATIGRQVEMMMQAQEAQAEMQLAQLQQARAQAAMVQVQQQQAMAAAAAMNGGMMQQ